jgi:patatin-related protein
LREKELRLALVCYGGVSLAIYMHGVTGEVHKLVRASKAYNAVPEPSREPGRRFAEWAEAGGYEYETEELYFELLKLIGERVELRVIVDVIAGASAGGINGILLARGLAHDLPVGPLRDLWLDEADVTRLLARESIAKSWSKWFLKPFIWAFSRVFLPELSHDPEAAQKLSLFVRSRWFRPPFNGRRLTRLLLRAIAATGQTTHENSSLLPPGHRLTLFVTLTDFHGYPHALPLHDPPFIVEQEHRHVLRFDYQTFSNGDMLTDLDDANAPAMAFAARATSAFPGAFPPAQLIEIDAQLDRMGMTWERRERFLRRNFGRYLQSGINPDHVAFIDGSVLNNKPFKEAIQAIQGRAAYREVDRRIVYIDPDPARPPVVGARPPGFFRVLKGALSDIPRSEPIADDLAWIKEYNESAARLRDVIEKTRPRIMRLVGEVTGPSIDGPFEGSLVKTWREAANTRAAAESGFAYESFVRLKIDGVRRFVWKLVATLADIPEGAPAEQWVQLVLGYWMEEKNIDYEGGAAPKVGDATKLPPWVWFLLSFDVAHRERRLRFVIQAINRIYPRLETREFKGVTAEMLDGLKRQFYDALDKIRQRGDPRQISAATIEKAKACFADAGERIAEKYADTMAAQYVETAQARITELIESIAADMNLKSVTDLGDTIIATVPTDPAGLAVRRELIYGYVGFAYWDVLAFSFFDRRDLGEFNEIKVDRISPDDVSLPGLSGIGSELKGAGLRHFGAFFSRANREHDYLWGRLHAVDRLVDIVLDASGIDSPDLRAQAAVLKRRAISMILDRETARLGEIGPLLATIKAQMGGAGS